MKYAKAFETWQEQTKAKRKLRVAATKVVLRWANKTLTLAWGKWWEEVRHGRVSKKATLKWMQKTICAAWRTWETRAKELRRQKGVLQKMALRMRHAGMYKAWAWWRYHDKAKVKETRKIIDAGAKVILRWQRLGLSKGFYGWSEHAASQRRMAIAAKKIVTRWEKMKYAKAFGAWEEQTKAQRKLRVAAKAFKCLPNVDKRVPRVQTGPRKGGYLTVKEEQAMKLAMRAVASAD
jgi:hypothetical protein